MPSLVSAEPADGSMLSQAPKTVQLRFNETVAPAVVSLIDAAGKRARRHRRAPSTNPS